MRIRETHAVSDWIRFFPEIKNEHELEELLKKTSCWPLTGPECSQEENFCVKIETVLAKTDSPELAGILAELSEDNPFYTTFHKLINFYYDRLDVMSWKDQLADVEGAKKEFLESLCGELLTVAIRVLIEEVNLARMAGILQGENPEERFQYYIGTLWKDTEYILYYYQKYSLLYETLMNLIQSKIVYENQIISRLCADRKELIRVFFQAEDPGKIESIDYSKGDSHRGGKNVVIVRFQNQMRLVYKPRSVQLETGFSRLLSWINDKQGKKNGLYTMKALDCREYGYIEFINYEECTSRQDVAEFYLNTGKLLCAVYLLGGKDFHHENIVAKGASPVIVDLDALFHSSLNVDQETGASSYLKALDTLNDSVYSTGMLPHVVSNSKDETMEGIDVSGLQGAEEQVSPFRTYRLKNKNTDEIRLEESTFIIKPYENIPIFQGKKEKASSHVREIMSGFREVYLLAQDSQDELQELLREAFAGARSRLILRPTYLYGQLMNTSQHPDFMERKRDRRIFLSRMACRVPEEQMEIVHAEISDILRADVPLFETEVMGRSVFDSTGRKLQVSQEKIPFLRVCRKIQNLSPAGLEEQLDIIRNSFKIMDLETFRMECQTATRLIPGNVLNQKQYLDAARRIGDWILEESVTGKDRRGQRSRSWLGYTNVGTKQIRFEYEVLLPDLYSGSSGIALFLLYLGSVTQDERYIGAATEAMAGLVSAIEKWDDSVNDMLIGPYNGLSGYLLVLFELYSMTAQKEIYGAAVQVLKTMERAVINDRTYDFLSGSAGAIMVLKRIYEKTDDIFLKDSSARLIGNMVRHIIADRTDIDGSMAVWTGLNKGIYFSGFAHGTAGISAALLRAASLYEKPEEIYETIAKTLEFERSLYDPVQNNWSSDQKLNRYSMGWCHGAPGILLNRIMLAEQGYYSKDLEQDIENSCRKVRQDGLGHNVCYCHGDLGNLEILSSCAKLRKDERLLQECRGAYGQIISQADRYLKKGGTNPKGLMLGYIGIGYGALRFIEDGIPSVLRLE